jgi:hypothetical protein
MNLPDGTICEEILPTTNGGDAIEQIVFAARENSEWAKAENILAENYMLKVKPSLFTASCRVRTV